MSSKTKIQPVASESPQRTPSKKEVLDETKITEAKEVKPVLDEEEKTKPTKKKESKKAEKKV